MFTFLARALNASTWKEISALKERVDALEEQRKTELTSAIGFRIDPVEDCQFEDNFTEPKEK